jgi:hypothetical protein
MVNMENKKNEIIIDGVVYVRKKMRKTVRPPLVDNEYKKSLIDDAITALGESFLWDKTTEGYDYWEKIYDRLIEISDGAVE